VIEVYKTVEEPVTRARNGKGPSLIECQTYRIEGHFVGDPLLYRDKVEVEDWKKRCPVLGLERYLKEEKILDEHKIADIKDKIALEIQSASEYAEKGELPGVERLLTDVFAE